MYKQNNSVNNIASRLAALEKSVGTSNDAASSTGSIYARIKRVAADLSTHKELSVTIHNQLGNRIDDVEDELEGKASKSHSHSASCSSESAGLLGSHRHTITIS